MKKKGLVNCASTHRIEHWWFMGHGREFESDITDAEQEGDFYWPAMPERGHQDIFSEPTPSKEFLEDWMVRTCELIDRYHIHELYFDWWIQHSSAKPYLKKIAAYYYNRALEWGEEVMITYKHDAYAFGTATIDIERGQFGSIQPYYWQTCTAIAKNSWGYTENNTFKNPRDIVCDLIDIVSKNGCMILNVGPKPDGSISAEDRAVLEAIGRWMKVNGEGIYETRAWRQAEEGPTRVKEGQFTDGEDKVFTSEDFRFTCKGDKVYAFCLHAPENGKVTIKALADADASLLPRFHGIIRSVSVLGECKEAAWTRDEEGLHVEVAQRADDYPLGIRIEID